MLSRIKHLFVGLIFISFAQLPLANDTTDTLQTSATPAAKTVKLLMKTNKGDIEIELNAEKAPISVENFLTYVDSQHYHNTLFHRVIPGFMIQGGGYTSDMRQKATLPPITNEAQNGLTNVRGSLAMARRQDKDSATSQFFINLTNNRFLNHGYRDFGYAVFGKVIAGMDVVDAIAAVPTASGNQPVEPVVITSVKRIATNNATPEKSE